jgi:hydroxymethylpyrimidine pyrophosphatase-like HAD family hydrolase
VTLSAQQVTPSAPAGALLVTDLLCGPEILATRLRAALREEQWLDAFLLAAGLGQMIEDRLHPDLLLSSRAAAYLRGLPSRPARLAGSAAAAGGAVIRLGTAPARRRLRPARDAVTELACQLAGSVIAPQPPAGLAARVAPLLATATAALPAIAGDVLRIPTCFHSFDQHPDDVRWLVAEFRRRYPRPDVPLCVVGVRTSGSYLAPLHAAALQASGDAPVHVLTYRPGRPFLRWERSLLRAVGRAGGLVLVVDDPPGTGTSLAAAAEAAGAAGVPWQAIVFLLSLFGPAGDLPARLHRWQAVVQPWPDWSVQARLGTQRVTGTLATLLPPGVEVSAAEPLGLPWPAQDRGHARARFSVALLDRRTGESGQRQIMVEGAGLGFLGRHAVAVAGALPDQVPHIYGFADGLLYRDWLPPGPVTGTGQGLAEVIAGYVNARRQALPAPAASVDRMGGRDAVWEVAGRLLSGQFGPLALVARPILVNPLMRRLLCPGQPTVLDGKTDQRHWLADPAAAGRLRKTDFYQRSFGHLDLACYDPVCDLAGAAADPPSDEFEALLRAAYHHASGQPVDSERWLLYRLAQLWRMRYAGDLDSYQVRLRSAAAIHDYLAGQYLSGLRAAAGPLCAIDLDGVLECDRLGYPATSPTGALALRALIAHGYRPVLATGRSVPDVRDRCTVFGLAGGVAEYGCAIVHDGEVIDLRPPRARELIGQIRTELAGYPGVRVDPRYVCTVRAASAGGPLPPGLLARIGALADPAVRVIQGHGQTDITAAGADKGSGLRVLAARLGGPSCALAVGDTPPDLPMLACASLARAPRNARLGDAGKEVKRTRRAYQAGLSQACGELIGHPPGRCQGCRPPAFSARARAVLAILDLRADGLASIPAGTLAMSRSLLARARW